MNAQKIIELVEKHRDLMINAEKYLWENPETGYKEFKSTKYLVEKYEELGYELIKPEDVTGFYTVIDTGREGPKSLILGELDSIICPYHKDSDAVTGAVHSCGHHVQNAALLGVAAALKEEGALDGLCGKIMLCAVPAEELLEIEYRRELMQKGKIKYFTGKSEFLSRGYFDDVDIAFMVHVSAFYGANSGMVGCIAKNITYKGKAAHAGGAPQLGINALYAANCGLNAINAIRETFTENEQIRVHPIITNGGDMVNAIPEKAVLESYVRGADFESMEKENKKVNRALIGAALSLGANIEIIDSVGYAPLNNDANMMKLAKDALAEILPEETFTDTGIRSTGSTDMGDLSGLMPVVHPYCKGSTGTLHGSDFYIEDPGTTCLNSAKWQLGMLTLLLENEAQRAKSIIKEFKPMFNSAKEYLEYVDSISSVGERIEYSDGGAKVIL